MPQGEIKTRIARVFIDDDGIIQKIFLPQAEESLEDAVEVWEAVKKLSNGVPRPMLVDFTELRKMDSKARSYYAEQDTWQTVSACAGITRSFVGKVISNFFLGFNKTPNPTKLFNSKEEALEWLKRNKSSSTEKPEA